MTKNGKHPRVSEELSGILSSKELRSLDARRAVTCLLNNPPNGKGIVFRNGDSPELQDKVRRHYEKLKGVNPSGHILFKGIQDLRLVNLMLEEALHWNIKSDVDLEPSAATAILQQYEGIDNLPINVHKKPFPLMMSGYILGHSTRVAIYAALLAQSANSANSGYTIDPVIAAISGFWHDIGKNEKSQKAVSMVQGKYEPWQYERIKKHPILGAKAIKAVNASGHSPIPEEIRQEVESVALKHHVRPDLDINRSYPKGIEPKELDPLIQMIAIADAFDAMTTRDHMLEPHERTMDNRPEKELRTHCGAQFNPDLVEIFLKLGIQPKSGDLSK